MARGGVIGGGIEYLHDALDKSPSKQKQNCPSSRQALHGPCRHFFTTRNLDRASLFFSFSTKTTNSNLRRPVIYSTWLATPMRVSRLILPHF